MSLKSLEIVLEYSKELSVINLRNYILEALQVYGEPLRWAITEVENNEKSPGVSKLFIEAVVVIY